MVHPACLSAEDLLKSVRVERLRGSGPGGQRRNRVATAVRLIHEPTGVTAKASERRSAEENRKEAVRRLRLALAAHHRDPVASDAPCSVLWQRRMVDSPKIVSARHADLAALLAEALDRLAVFDDDLPATAQALHLSPTRFVKLLKLQPRLLSELNGRLKASHRRPWH